MPRIPFSAPGAPPPIGPYSVAARAAGSSLVFLSGQTPIDPETGALVDGGIGEQTRQALRNLETVLRAVGGSFEDAVKVNVYLASMDDFSGMNEVYDSFFTAPHPARTTVAVAGLPLGALVEIELVASLP
ncbi:MAG: Rid family detoxifying hydrolase [Microbacterium sp.]|uniref:RidA family protein n=1 Tax=Microbacterium sp. TaxID=51671 RepID=UPI0039E6C05C